MPRSENSTAPHSHLTGRAIIDRQTMHIHDFLPLETEHPE